MAKTWEVFWRFLLLGCVSFGGPAAHIGYFQKTFVEKLQWLDMAAYARLISLSQFLPGPGSSQMGFAIGHRRAGLSGAIAAFIGFTTPSFLLMYCLANVDSQSDPNHVLTTVIYGLKLLAVVVVADATLTMSKTFCTDKKAISITIISTCVLLFIPNLWTQLIILACAAYIGMLLHKGGSTTGVTKQGIKLFPLIIFFMLFFGLPFGALFSEWLGLFNDFYRSGSLVFGGGHVVLPLLQQTLAETMSTDRFLLGYAAAQGVPGPMFSLATFLGVDLSPGHPLAGALITTAGIFLPGFLLILSLQGAWETLVAKPQIKGAVWGINAAVVGLLLSALYKPVFVSAVTSPMEMALVLIGFYLLNILKLPIVILVFCFAMTGFIL